MTATACCICSKQAHSSGEWGLCWPVDKFGVGRPSSVSRDPSVPPRIMVSFGFRPNRSKAPLGVIHGPRFPRQSVGHVAILLDDLDVDLRAWKLCHRLLRRLPQLFGQCCQLWRAEISQKNSQRDFATPPLTTYGCKKPSRPSVVSGENSFRGNRATKSAVTRKALTILPLAIEG